VISATRPSYQGGAVSVGVTDWSHNTVGIESRGHRIIGPPGSPVVIPTAHISRKGWANDHDVDMYVYRHLRLWTLEAGLDSRIAQYSMSERPLPHRR
jgi:hypothetical protein